MGQEDPVRAYTNEGFDMYEEMTRSIQEDTVKFMMNVEMQQNIRRKQVLVPEGESLEELDNSDDESNLNRAERRRLEREASKSNVKR